MICSACNAQLKDGAKFCSECGAAQRKACHVCDATLAPSARFCQECGTPVAGSTPATRTAHPLPGALTVTEPTTTKATSGAGERRHMSVMFCDLVGSVDISRQLDPEDLGDLVRSYRAACATVIDHHGGTSAQFHGDGIVVYFGYPVAHEDDARRAVQAGLEIIQSIAKLRPSVKQTYNVDLAVRISVHTGLTIVGDADATYGDGRLALGDTPNLAARLQQVAAPNSVVISESTHRLVLGFFEMTSLGAHTFKGLLEPIEVFSVAASRNARSRLDAAPEHLRVPYVGRANLVETLAKGWKEAKAGRGNAVLLTGDPGMGKSRLLSEFRNSIADEEFETINCFCSPYYSQTPLYPLAAPMQDLFASEPSGSPAAALAVLRDNLVRLGCEIDTALPLMAKLMGFTPDAGYEPLALHPLTLKQKTQLALVTMLTSAAATRPVLLIMEDLHWVDETTLELLSSILQGLPRCRMLLLLTARKGFKPSWVSDENLTILPLALLTENETRALIQKVVGDKALPEKVESLLVQKTGGNPLYVEEMTRMFMASGVLRETATGYQTVGALPDSFVPESLKALLTSRIDRLPPQARTVLQLGATIGREWSFELLLAAFPDQEESFSTGVQQLLAEGLLYTTAGGFIIKHALILDASYDSLLKRTRQTYHERIARALEAGAGGVAFAERIAQHWTKAAQPQRAVPLWLAAGQQAVAASATVEAESHLRQGLEALALLPDDIERDRTELAILSTLGVALTLRLGWAAPEVAEVYTRAQVLLERVGTTPHLFWLLWGMWAFYLVKGDQRVALELAQRMTRVADEGRDEGQQLEAHFAMGLSHHLMGNLDLTHHHLEAAVTQYSFEKHGAQAGLTGQDVGVCARSQFAVVLHLRGEPRQGLAQSLNAINLGTELGQPFSQAYALGCAAWLDAHRQNFDGMLEKHAMATVEIGTSQSLGFWVVWGSIFAGRGLAYSGNPAAGAKQIEEALAMYRGIGCGMLVPYFLTLLAEVEVQSANTKKALSHLALARQLIADGGEAGMAAEVDRMEAELRAQLPTADEVEEAAAIEALLRSALETAKRQGNRVFALRAATSLTRWLVQRNRTGEIGDALSTAMAAIPDATASIDMDLASAVLLSANRSGGG